MRTATLCLLKRKPWLQLVFAATFGLLEAIASDGAVGRHDCMLFAPPLQLSLQLG